MAGAIEVVGVVGSALSGSAVITTFIAYRWRRSRQLAEQRKKLARPPLELREGYCRLHGIAKKRRRSEDDVLASGCNVSVIVVSGRARYWKRSETRQEARSFNLLTDNGEKVRVCLRDSGWTLETAARERNGPERRSVEYELTDGERVWVEGELQAVERKRKGSYRDDGSLKRWQFKADGAEIRMWTEGALAAHEATEFLPPVFSILLWSFVAFMLGWSLSIAMGGQSAGWESVYFALTVALLSVSFAIVVVESMGGWIGSRPWFQRKE